MTIVPHEEDPRLKVGEKANEDKPVAKDEEASEMDEAQKEAAEERKKGGYQ
jgi:hypothetical protein